MRTVLVTGSASGLGAAVTAGLRDIGHRVIGLDIREADIVADLGNIDGRETAVAGVLNLCGGRLDGVCKRRESRGAKTRHLGIGVHWFRGKDGPCHGQTEALRRLSQCAPSRCVLLEKVESAVER